MMYAIHYQVLTVMRQNSLGVGVFGTKSALTVALKDTVMEIHVLHSLKKLRRCLDSNYYY